MSDVKKFNFFVINSSLNLKYVISVSTYICQNNDCFETGF